MARTFKDVFLSGPSSPVAWRAVPAGAAAWDGHGLGAASDQRCWALDTPISKRGAKLEQLGSVHVGAGVSWETPGFWQNQVLSQLKSHLCAASTRGGKELALS